MQTGVVPSPKISSAGRGLLIKMLMTLEQHVTVHFDQILHTYNCTF